MNMEDLKRKARKKVQSTSDEVCKTIGIVLVVGIFLMGVQYWIDKASGAYEQENSNESTLNSDSEFGLTLVGEADEVLPTIVRDPQILIMP